MYPVSLTIAKFCEATGLGKTATYKLISQKTLVTIKVGRRTLILMSSIEAWLAAAVAAESTDGRASYDTSQTLGP